MTGWVVNLIRGYIYIFKNKVKNTSAITLYEKSDTTIFAVENKICDMERVSYSRF